MRGLAVRVRVEGDLAGELEQVAVIPQSLRCTGVVWKRLRLAVSVVS
ncbi:hypothetical protein [Salinispora arenicola]|nr:hypothetical protein [Salinispora arenicola]